MSGQGVLRTKQYLPLYAPGPARIRSLNVRDGEEVAAGAVLIALDMPDLEQRRRSAGVRVEHLQWQLEVSGLDDTLRENQAVIREELAGARAELTGTLHERARFEIRAPFAGVLVDTSPELRAGVWTNPREKLGVLIAPSAWQVEIFLAENEIHRVRLGDPGRFYSEASGMHPLALRVVRIDPDATRQLAEAMLAVQHGGHILARERNGQLIPEQAIYRVVLQALPSSRATLPTRVLRGRVVVEGERKSPLAAYLRTAATVIVREAGW